MGLRKNAFFYTKGNNRKMYPFTPQMWTSYCTSTKGILGRRQPPPVDR